MRRVCYSVAMSLDGYIADPTGGYDWIVIDPEIDFGEMFKPYDAVVMGRKSYEAAKKQGGYGMPGPKAYVVSTTLTQADCPDATVLRDPNAVAELKKMKGKDIWLFGGGELFRSMLEHELVDAIEVAVIPVLLGDGIPLLPRSHKRAKLKLAKQKALQKTGTLMLNYDVTYPRGKASVMA